MVSSGAQPGRRLAEVLPSLLNAVGVEGQFGSDLPGIQVELPRVDAVVIVVVDGLGWSNLMQRKAHARFMMSQHRERIETVRPSTTGAALTTLLTGTLPGEHGLIGYRIRDEATGSLRCTLTDWSGKAQDAGWMRAAPLMQAAATNQLRPVAIGRPAHAKSGLTGALLSGAEYISAPTISDRFDSAADAILRRGSKFVYLYIDELDRAGHVQGWQSNAWAEGLEEIDSQLQKFVAQMPQSVGVVLTADHGMVDVPHHRQILMDAEPGLLHGVAHIGGEPRLRYLYLQEPTPRNREILAHTWRATHQKNAQIYTREEAINAALFGPVDSVVGERIGDVIVAASSEVAFYTSAAADEQSRMMIGQHGSFTEDEVGVPLLTLGAFGHR